jgi:TatD DNase family protein
MFVDIHTHHSADPDHPAIRNLTFAEAESILASNKKGLFSLGFHPWYAREFSEERMDKLREWSKDSRFVLLGECGLDKNSTSPFDWQLHVFKQQIALSEKAEKPMIIHCVGSYNELFELKKELNPHQCWIIHGFRGKPELAKQALHAGCCLSFGERFNIESVRLTPIDRLFIETYESLLPITEIYQSIARIRNCSVEELNAGENFIRTLAAGHANNPTTKA